MTELNTLTEKYTAWGDVNPALKGIRPRISLSQANLIAGWADAIKQPDSKSWPFAIAAFKKSYMVRSGKWVKRVKELEDMTKPEKNTLVKMIAEFDSSNKDDYLVVGDPELKTTWHLPVKKGGKPNRKLAAAAWAALFSTGGFRGNPYEGPDKAKAQKALKAIYADQGWPEPKSEAEIEMDLNIAETYLTDGSWLAELPDDYVPWGTVSFAALEMVQQQQDMAEEIQVRSSQLMQLLRNIIGADAVTVPNKPTALNALWKEYITIVTELMQNPDQGQGENQEESAQEGETSGEITQQEVTTPVTESLPPPVVLAETYGGADIEILEVAEADQAQPLRMKVQLIQPGWGNTRDNNFYPKEMLAKFADKFVGAKMYESDHKDDKSTRNWVSTVNSISGFTDDGAPIADVIVHAPDFAERIRNLKAGGILDKMECSILAGGVVEAGFELNGRKGRLVKELTDISSVDWVTRAGAGGKALDIAEVDAVPETPPIEPVIETPVETPVAPIVETPAPVVEIVTTTPVPVWLSEMEVQGTLNKTHLPTVSKERLGKVQYPTTEELQKAILSEIDYLKEVTGSGRPFGIVETAAPAPVSLEEINKRKDAVNQKFLARGTRY